MGNNKTNIAGSKIQEQGSVKMKSSMNNGFDLMALYGRNTGCSDKDSECRIYHINNETGAGMITVYNVFTGISAAWRGDMNAVSATGCAAICLTEMWR